MTDGILGLSEAYNSASDDEQNNDFEAGRIVTEEEDPIPDVLPEAPPGGFYGAPDPVVEDD